MKNRRRNYIAEETVRQINSTLDMLLEEKLAYNVNRVPKVDRTKIECTVTWNNHIPARENSGKSFTSIKQYEYILKNNSYHCLMYDGSLVRANFCFNDGVLISENLLWCPSPFSENADLLGIFTPHDLLEDIYGDKEWYKKINMRTPIRFDFDSKKHENNHTAAHAHFQHHDTHVDVIKPICFNRFIEFIFQTCYPSKTIRFAKEDYIEYRINELPQIDKQPIQLLFNR